MLPIAMATTTLRRTVPFRRCIQLEPIFVQKLNSASDPTAVIAGTCNPKIRSGSKSTPPPNPVRPMSVPTRKPIRILPAISGISEVLFAPLEARASSLRRVSVHANEALLFEVKDDFLRCLLGRHVGCVDHHFRLGWSFIGI